MFKLGTCWKSFFHTTEVSCSSWLWINNTNELNNPRNKSGFTRTKSNLLKNFKKEKRKKYSVLKPSAEWGSSLCWKSERPTRIQSWVGFHSPTEACRNLEPILVSVPTALATSEISAPVASQTADNELILEILWARNALAACYKSKHWCLTVSLDRLLTKTYCSVWNNII